MTNDEDGLNSYIQERKSLDVAEIEASKSFDQAMLTLSGGALGLSITYINDVAPNPIWGTKILVLFAWIMFGITLLSTLFSFLASQLAIRSRRAELDERQFPNHLPSPPSRYSIWSRTERCLSNWFGTADTWGETVDFLNVLSVFAFTIGVVLLTLFCSISFVFGEQKMSGHEPNTKNAATSPEQRGYRPASITPPTPKTPPAPSTAPSSDKK